MPLVYEQLRALAASQFRELKAGQTLQPTALVHEAFLRMVGSGRDWRDRAHFCATCAMAMRQILADHARRRRAAKRGGGWKRLTLSGVIDDRAAGAEVDVEALDQALDRLSLRNERQAQLVIYRFFGGLNMEEAASALGVSLTTVEKDWRVARAWLRAELGPESP
jgi:RNA polymerase sigma factor (TIGR02999 family)